MPFLIEINQGEFTLPLPKGFIMAIKRGELPQSRIYISNVSIEKYAKAGVKEAQDLRDAIIIFRRFPDDTSRANMEYAYQQFGQWLDKRRRIC